jgi:hypothetical protein
MARHRLTTEEQKKGTERALESSRTPPQLKKGLKKRKQQLEGNGNASSKKSKSDKSTERSGRTAEEHDTGDSRS